MSMKIATEKSESNIFSPPFLLINLLATEVNLKYVTELIKSIIVVLLYDFFNS